ncbi:MAG: helix-turn-helix domain-containing protein [Lachnospiraceae bacterium]|nr:helix-turn-helix domain-containing protein [Lachnospiraceae bacterium]
MKKEMRTICYDEELQIEAYHFEGIMQPFPNHFHEHYVIGFVESGNRMMSCKNREYHIAKDSIILFNPGDNHTCIQSSEESFSYRGFNISTNAMLSFSQEITKNNKLPYFSPAVITDAELGCYLQSLHKLVMSGCKEFEKEESFYLMLSLLLEKYVPPYDMTLTCCTGRCSEEIEKACSFLQEHYSEQIHLDQICRYAGLSKSTLLRAFTRLKGITPYRYLETIRISEAKKLLREGIPPAEAALQTGFSDQSHFTNFFNMFIGLTPGSYRDIFRKQDDGGNRGNADKKNAETGNTTGRREENAE